MRPEFRSVLLAEFYEGSEVTGRQWWSWKNSFFALNHSSKKYFKLLLFQKKKNNTTKHFTMLPRCTHLSVFHLIHSCSHDKSGTRERESGKKKRSNAPWPLEWQNGTFMMSPRLFPEMDGLSWNTNWLIHRLTECAAAVALLSCSFPGQNIQPDMLERMTNEWSYCRHRSCLSVHVCCDQDACWW